MASFKHLKVISGGQTGVDRAALDVALHLDLDHGGWCPKGRRAEDGAIPAVYQLIQMPTPSYAARTRKNVLEADATLILYCGEISGGTALTQKIALQNSRPVLEIDLLENSGPNTTRDWLRKQQVEVLNVAGPRESTQEGVRDLAYAYLKDVLESTPQP